jgi:short-subunit dehydrogenase
MKREVIVITGCSSGIGLESAIYLKERFLKVYPTARKESDVERLKALGFDGAMQLDVRKPEDISKVIETVLEKEGKIDIWFNNAGYGQMGALEDLDIKLVKEQFDTNVFGLFEATKQIIPVMKRQGFGKIIQHSSVLGLVSLPLRGAYNASKYAVEGLADTWRLELKDTNISMILLDTGPITSKFRENALKTLENVDYKESRWKDVYEKSLKGEGKRVPFSLPAVEVARLIHQISLDPTPKPRYYITKATWILAMAKRLLSTSLLDRLLLKV